VNIRTQLCNADFFTGDVILHCMTKERIVVSVESTGKLIIYMFFSDPFLLLLIEAQFLDILSISYKYIIKQIVRAS
jgi:hypothetical protein